MKSKIADLLRIHGSHIGISPLYLRNMYKDDKLTKSQCEMIKKIMKGDVKVDRRSLQTLRILRHKGFISDIKQDGISYVPVI